MKRKVTARYSNPSPSLGQAMQGRTYVYELECGHKLTRLPRKVKGSRVHPKTLDCSFCDGCTSAHDAVMSKEWASSI